MIAAHQVHVTPAGEVTTPVSAIKQTTAPHRPAQFQVPTTNVSTPLTASNSTTNMPTLDPTAPTIIFCNYILQILSG